MIQFMKFKYMRVQGREIAPYTEFPNGIFGIFREFERKNVLTEEDYELYKEILNFFETELPWPALCNEKQKVVCFFKMDTSTEMMKYLKPMLWLLERYNHPYDVIFTNFPGNILYEDEYQIVVAVDDLIYDKVDYINNDIFSTIRKKGQNKETK